MEIGDKVTVCRGDYKGLVGVVSRILKEKYVIKSTYDSDDDCDGYSFYEGDVNHVPKKDIDIPCYDLTLIQSEIRRLSLTLSGLILKRDKLIAPLRAEINIKKELELLNV